MRKEFEDLYQKELFPILKTLEKKRELILFSFLLGETLLIVLSAAVIYVCSIAIDTDNTLLLYSTFIILPFLIFSIIILYFTVPKHFKKIVKKNCVPIIKKSHIISDWKYSGTDRNNLYELENTHLFPSFTHVDIDDGITGFYNGVRYYVADVNLIDEVSNRVPEAFQSIYRGVIISLPSKKRIKASVRISSKWDFGFRLANYYVLAFLFVFFFLLLISIPMILTGHPVLIGCGVYLLLFVSIVAYLIYKSQNKISTVKLEDLKFDRRFRVYSENQIEARYLVTPAFMDRLYNLKTAFGTRNIKCSFLYNKIIFAIRTNKDLFELGSLFCPLTKGKQAKEFFKELSSVHDIIDYFKFDEKTGL